MGASRSTHEMDQQRQTKTNNDGLFEPTEFATPQSTYREGKEACSKALQCSALP